MVFSKKIEKICGHCIHATILDEDSVECAKKGVKDRCDKCLSFSYDPCKRIPAKPKATDFAKYEDYDYSL